MTRAIVESLETGAAALAKLAKGERLRRSLPLARAWTEPVALLLTFRSPASARLALRLLGAHDPKAERAARAAVSARVPFGIAAAAVVAVGVEELLALGAAPPSAGRGRGHVRVLR